MDVVYKWKTFILNCTRRNNHQGLLSHNNEVQNTNYNRPIIFKPIHFPKRGIVVPINSFKCNF